MLKQIAKRSHAFYLSRAAVAAFPKMVSQPVAFKSHQPVTKT
jgi:hypothetical protein